MLIPEYGLSDHEVDRNKRTREQAGEARRAARVRGHEHERNQTFGQEGDGLPGGSRYGDRVINWGSASHGPSSTAVSKTPANPPRNCAAA
jgi:hypothetical protein